MDLRGNWIMDKKLSFTSHVVIGVMLFALFFGAGNLIFPAELGQYAGSNVWLAIFGFLLTGVGLPFLGILAIAYSGSSSLQALAGRIHPIYGVVFTSLLYLTIGPFFAAPRTGAVAFDIAITPFIGESNPQVASIIFTLIFFGVVLWLSLNPAKIVDRIGKILSPVILVLLIILLIFVIVKPMGTIGQPEPIYMTGALLTGFVEGYNTMDALGALVYGIIIINVIRAMGVTTRRGILLATIKTGFVATFFLTIIYTGIAYLGVTSVQKIGLLETGGAVLSEVSIHYFGSAGILLLGIVMIFACLTTAIGLMTACGEYFHTLMPKVSYKIFVTIFTTICFIVANFGLANIISYSIPLLMFIYPLAIVLMLLTFTSSLFRHARFVYVSATVVTFMISSIDGLKTFCELMEREYYEWLAPIIKFYGGILPFYNDGLGWLFPVLITVLVTGIIVRKKKVVPVQASL